MTTGLALPRALRLGHRQTVQSDDAGDRSACQCLGDEGGSLGEVALVSVPGSVSLEWSAEGRRDLARRSGRLDRQTGMGEIGEALAPKPRFDSGDLTARRSEHLHVLPRSQPLVVQGGTAIVEIVIQGLELALVRRGQEDIEIDLAGSGRSTDRGGTRRWAPRGQTLRAECRRPGLPGRLPPVSKSRRSSPARHSPPTQYGRPSASRRCSSNRASP